MSRAPATDAAPAVPLQERRACAACGDPELVPELELVAVPVHMGCIDQPVEDDAFADQRWATCARCAGRGRRSSSRARCTL